MWPKLGFAKVLILSEEKRSQAALEGNIPESALPQIGTEATVTAALRPAGKVAVGDTEYDAVSLGNFITEGSKVRVVHLEGAKVVVEEQ
jgi:membrane-bound ClpP family serine protease